MSAPARTNTSSVRVVSKCPVCKKIDEFEISAAGLRARTKGAKLHEAHPELSKERLEQLARHVCPACQSLEVR